MAQFIIRKLKEIIKRSLERRAARSGRREEVRHIVRSAVKQNCIASVKLGSRIAARFAKRGLTEPLPELRRQAPCRSRYATQSSPG